MNHNLNEDQRIQFKNWIKKRFISEADVHNLSFKETIIWSIALRELADELINTLTFSHIGTHHIVPFRRKDS